MLATESLGLEFAGQLGLSGLAGLAIGIEREWSGHASGPGARFGGVRTFLLLGLTGGIAGLLTREGWLAMGAVLVAGASLLSCLAYVLATYQTADRDGTTEAAALLVLAIGVLCGLGFGGIGSGVAALAVLALAEKNRIRGLISRIGETGSERHCASRSLLWWSCRFLQSVRSAPTTRFAPEPCGRSSWLHARQ